MSAKWNIGADAEQCGVLRDYALGRHRYLTRIKSGVGEHHPLREAGCAARIEHAEQGLAAATRILDRVRLREQAFVTQHPGRRLAVSGVDDVAQRTHVLPQLRPIVLKVSSTIRIDVSESLSA